MVGDIIGDNYVKSEDLEDAVKEIIDEIDREAVGDGGLLVKEMLAQVRQFSKEASARTETLSLLVGDSVSASMKDKLSRFQDEVEIIAGNCRLALHTLHEQVFDGGIDAAMEQRLGPVTDLNLRGFWGRLRWLLTGR